ncbi:MAG: hypothetical protein AAF717_05475 [Bacteroidota bacterium]
MEMRVIRVYLLDFKVSVNDGFLTMISRQKQPALLGWDISRTMVLVGNKVHNIKLVTAFSGL